MVVAVFEGEEQRTTEIAHFWCEQGVLEGGNGAKT